ncbi:MAG: LamG-like jellyroll fold domain-containing protein [Phycisphaerae bacterium]
MRQSRIVVSLVGLALSAPNVHAQLGWHTGIGGAGCNDDAYAVIVADVDGTGLLGPQVVVAGRFTAIHNTTISRIARWDGAAWHALGSGVIINSSIRALAVFDEDGIGSGAPALFAAGSFTSISQPSPATINRIAKWTGSAWVDVGPAGLGANGTITSLYVSTIGGTPALYAGGLFTSIGGVAASNIARWDGTNWSALGVGVDGQVYAMSDYGVGAAQRLYVGGSFINAGGNTAEHIAAWDATNWSAVGTGLNDPCLALTTHNGGSGQKLYAGGSFSQAGGSQASRVAEWNGTTWTAVTGAFAEGVNDRVFALKSFDAGDGGGSALYAGGEFTSAGDRPARRVARYDCQTWYPLSQGAGDRVTALAVGPALPNLNGLWTVGVFDAMDFQGAGRVARYVAPDCNYNNVFDPNELCGGTTPCPLDCNANCNLDSCDITSGYSLDCNRNNVPDECDPPCPPTQASLPDGGNCSGPPPTQAWTRTVKLLRGWLQRDGDPIFGRGEGIVGWKNRPADSNYIFDQYPRPKVNLGAFDHKVERTKRGAQDCSGRRQFNFNHFGWREVYGDEGPDFQDVANNTFAAQVSFWFAVAERDKGLKLSSRVILEKSTRDLDDTCEGHHNATRIAGQLEKYLLDPSGLQGGSQIQLLRTIGRLVCPTGAADPSPSSPNCPTESTTSCPPITANMIEWALTDTPRNKPAHIQLDWQVRSNSYQGQRVGDPVSDRVAGNAGGEIIRYEFLQRSGSEMYAKAQMHTDHLVRTLNTGHTRTFRYLFDIDANTATGDNTDPLCGADYDVRVVLIASLTPDRREIVCASSAIYAWCGDEWIETGNSPIRFEALQDRVDVLVSMTHLGICSPGRPINSWLVTEYDSQFADVCPNAPCGTRVCLTIAPDEECPQVVEWRTESDADGNILSIDVDLTEPVVPVAPSDVALVPQGTTIPVPVTITMYAAMNGFTILPASGSFFPAGIYTLTIFETIHDSSGLHLDGNLDGTCGGNASIEICIEDEHTSGGGEDGIRRDEFEPAETIFAQAKNLPPNQQVMIYLLDAGDIEEPGDLLIDLSDDGPNLVTTTLLGTIPNTPIGAAIHQREYRLAIDVDRDGYWMPGIDHANGYCAAPFSVGEPCEEALDDMIAYWSMDEAGNAPAAHESVFRNHAVKNGSPQSVPGVVGRALSFSPTASLTVADDAALDFGTYDFSIEFWINRSAGAGNAVLFEKVSAIGWALDSIGTDVQLVLLQSPFGIGYASVGGSITPGVWHHVAFVADRESGADELRIYIDGQIDVVYSGVPVPTLDNSAALQILRPSGVRPIIAIDEPAIYEAALTSADVQQIFNTASRCLDLPPCPGDLNGDGVIDLFDLASLLANFGTPSGAHGGMGDVTGDGSVDLTDLATLLANFGSGCG